MENRLEILMTLKDEASAKLKSFSGNLDQLQPMFQAAAVAGTAAFAALAAGIYTSVKASIQAKDEQARLNAILKNTTGATDDQIAALNEQAEALERVGVIDAGTIKSAQSKLATFDMTTRAIGELTPALLDYAVAEYGASVSGEQLANVANGFGKALQGKTDLLTKAGFNLTAYQIEVLKTGTETQRLAMMNEILGKTYNGLNEKMRQTTQGGLIGMKMEVERLKQSVGDALVPALDALIQKVSPIITKIVDWVAKNQDIVRGIIVAVGVITGLIAILGTLGVAFVAASAAATMLGVTVYALLGPIGWVIGAISLLGVGAGVAAYKMGQQKDATEELTTSSGDLKTRMGELSTSIGESGKKSDETAKKLKELKKQMQEIIEEGARLEADSRKSIAETFVEQEQKVTDISKELADKRTEINKARAEKESIDTIYGLRAEADELENKLIREQSAINANRQYLMGLDAEYAEAKRRAALTEFQRKLEDIVAEQKARREDTAKKIKEKQAEIDELIKEEKRFTSTVVSENAKQIASYNAVAAARASAMSGSYSGSSSFSTANSTPAVAGRRAQGGNVAQGSTYLVGENGAEYFTPNSSGIVSNKIGGGGNFTVNINGGTYLSEEVAGEIGDMIMDKFKRTYRL